MLHHKEKLMNGISFTNGYELIGHLNAQHLDPFGF